MHEFPKPSAASASSLPPEPTEQPPTLPDTKGWVRRAPGDVIEAGTPYVIRFKDGAFSYSPDSDGVDWRLLDNGSAVWTPPPAPSEPWSSISTDRDKPTLARVDVDEWPDGIVSRWWRDEDRLYNDENEPGRSWFHADSVTAVTVLRTCPETHVPVERALIDEAARFVTNWDTGESNGAGRVVGFMRALASLASDESSASDGGRS